MNDDEIAVYLASAEGLGARAGDPTATTRLAALAAAHPGHALLACYHADALHSAGRRAEAAVAYREALKLDDTLFDAWYGLGGIGLANGAYGEAVTTLGRALALRPDAAGVRCNLGEALFNLGLVEAAVEQYRRAARAGDAAVRANAQRAIALVIVGSAAADDAAILRARRTWLAPFGVARPRPAARNIPNGSKLRVGYLSAFFGARNWMKPVWAVINRHDRARMQIHLIADGGEPTAASGYREHAEDHVWQVRGLSNHQLAQHIAGAELDVLVDLNGYSSQARLPLFLLRPAPRIIGWFNTFATTGMEVFDAIVGDAAVLPPEEERWYTERVVRVPGSYLAFEVGYPVPDVAPPPCLEAGRITFGCLASAYKLTEAVLDGWTRILAAAPRAHLLLKNASLDDPSNAAAMIDRFARRGIAPDRVTLAGGGEHYAFVAEYDRVDVALDTFPYNGGTTTTEALWQGVPVLTFDGDRWSSRTSKSLLLAAGLHDWVAVGIDGYVARAIALAQDPQTPVRLAALRATMRRRLAATPACDTERLCRSLERIYRSTDHALGATG